ncbi:hypothetical protein C8Q75DRAFT_810597 [Abortiporus biennis]|nr:hypothetical protein C8Q75DRAFT_810597 [Abortiporus biennis]
MNPYSLTFILIIFEVDSTIESVEVIAGASIIWLRNIAILRMILDLKSIDQVSIASLPDMQCSRFSSIYFIGNIGAPLGTMDTKNDEDEEAVIPKEVTVTRVSARQIIEDPLSIGLLDGKYNNSNIKSEREYAPVSGTSENVVVEA